MAMPVQGGDLGIVAHAMKTEASDRAAPIVRRQPVGGERRGRIRHLREGRLHSTGSHGRSRERIRAGIESGSTWSEKVHRAGHVMPAAIAPIGVVYARVHRLPRRRPNSFYEVAPEGTNPRQTQNWMRHPQWQSRLLQVGKSEISAQVLRVDYVSHSEGQRFPPGDDLTAEKQG